MRMQEGSVGAITGAAIGDALGGATEGFSPEQIQLRYNGFVEGIVEPFNRDWKNARPVSPFHKGDGHITDDTLMTESLISIYEKVRDHLDAFLFAENIIPELIEKKRWIPELHEETLLVHRVFHAEKWLVHKLHHGHADPREGGVGNIVNCGDLGGTRGTGSRPQGGDRIARGGTGSVSPPPVRGNDLRGNRPHRGPSCRDREDTDALRITAGEGPFGPAFPKRGTG